MTETASDESTEPPDPAAPTLRTPALQAGTICAVAGQSQRQMRGWAADHPALYGGQAFDSALFSTLALAAAFSGPGLSADRLRTANRVCLWCFGLDWLIDYAASSADDVSRVVDRCAAVVHGTPTVERRSANGTADAEDELARFLTDIHGELESEPAFPGLRDVWLDELRRVLDAMALEWHWKTARAAGDPGPTFDEYLANADNLGFSFVFTSHWIASGGGGDISRVRLASRAVQRVVRLLNDLGTYERDLRWGDLNGLLLDRTRGDVRARIADLTREARTLLRDAAETAPDLAEYMERQMDFCSGFYGVTDFWGTL